MSGNLFSKIGKVRPPTTKLPKTSGAKPKLSIVVAAAKPTTHPRVRAQKAPENAKTALCRTFAASGQCAYGKSCTFAHGTKELKPHKTRQPCWFFNRDGCSKSDLECECDHVVAPNMRKPRNLQHPCLWHHVCGYCRLGNRWGGDHDYELTAPEWKHHFSEPFPGDGYLTQEVLPLVEQEVVVKTNWPIVGSTQWAEDKVREELAREEEVKDKRACAPRTSRMSAEAAPFYPTMMMV